MPKTSGTLSDKQVVDLIFKELKKRGFVAEQNFSCCQLCAWREIPAGKDDDIVFYTMQENRFDTEGYLERNHLVLTWRGNGHAIKQVAEEHGFRVHWNEENNHQIGLISPYRKVLQFSDNA